MELDFHGLISLAQKGGAQEVEVFYEDEKTNYIEVYQQEVETLISSHPRGIGIRLFKDGRMGFAYTSNFSQEGQRLVVQKALENAMVVSKNPLKSLPSLYEDYPKMDFYNPHLGQEPVEKKIELLLFLEEEALKYHKRIHSIPELGYQDFQSRVILVNSKGLHQKFKRSICYAYLVVLAREGDDVQTGIGLTHGRSLSLLDPVTTVRKACEEALILLGAKSVPSKKAPVVFKPEEGASILDIIGDVLTGEAVQKRRSLFAHQLGERVASPMVTLVDDGLLPEGLASQPFDGEGVPSSRTTVIEEGILKTYLYDTYTSRKDKTHSTGNAVRSSYQSLPGVAPTNFFLAPGTISQEELLGGVENGFYVMNLRGLNSGINAISGDFSLGASGRWIRKGEFQESVKDVTIAGNLSHLLNQITGVASDLTFNPLSGTAGAPTMVVDSLSISGR